MASNLPSLELLLGCVSEETLEKPCSDEHMVKIASEITGWQIVAPHLGLTPVDEENIAQNHRDVQVQQVKMLRTWQQKSGSKATYASLAKALHKAKRVDLVEKVVELLTEKAAATGSIEIRSHQHEQDGSAGCKQDALNSGVRPIPQTTHQSGPGEQGLIV